MTPTRFAEACEAGANAADRTAAKARAMFANPVRDPFNGDVLLRAQAEQDYEHVVRTARYLRALATALRGAAEVEVRSTGSMSYEVTFPMFKIEDGPLSPHFVITLEPPT